MTTELLPRRRFKRKFGDAKLAKSSSVSRFCGTFAKLEIDLTLIYHLLNGLDLSESTILAINPGKSCKMLSRRLAVTRPLARSLAPATGRVLGQSRLLSQADIEDPNMNGGYPEPPRVNRQSRDPYGDWWDKQERRNFGEPLHEDNDILGIFSLYEYKHVKPGKGALQLLTFVGTVYGLYVASSFVYPDRPSVPKEYEGGLDKELGGEGAVLAPKAGD